jgi:hypothetical protein
MQLAYNLSCTSWIKNTTRLRLRECVLDLHSTIYTGCMMRKLVVLCKSALTLIRKYQYIQVLNYALIKKLVQHSNIAYMRVLWIFVYIYQDSVILTANIESINSRLFRQILSTQHCLNFYQEILLISFQQYWQLYFARQWIVGFRKHCSAADCGEPKENCLRY